MTEPSATQARVGRPRQTEGAADVREQLLDAAIRLATERGIDATSIRAIADEAGVTPGMISYYFGGKQGLSEAMIDRVYERIVARVRAFLDEPEAGDPLTGLVQFQVATFASAPWLPQLVVREVLAKDGPLRKFFIARIASGPATLVPALLRREMASGRIRDDLDPALTMLSLMGMLVFPFLAYPVLHDVLGYEIDQDFRDRLTAHTCAIVERGLAPEGAS